MKLVTKKIKNGYKILLYVLFKKKELKKYCINLCSKINVLYKKYDNKLD